MEEGNFIIRGSDVGITVFENRPKILPHGNTYQ